MRQMCQQRMTLAIVSIVLLLDSMLNVTTEPIIAEYLQGFYLHKIAEDLLGTITNSTDEQNPLGEDGSELQRFHPIEGDSKVPAAIAFKALIQIIVSPLAGYVVGRIGYSIPLVIGLSAVFCSSLTFAFAHSFGSILAARGLHGVGSALIITAGFSLLADRYTTEKARRMAMGTTLAFISFGCIVSPPIGGVLYQLFGKEILFLALASLVLLDGVFTVFIMRHLRQARMVSPPEKAKRVTTPIHKLLLDPYILVCAGALMAAQIPPAFLEPTLFTWMQDTMHSTNAQTGLVWLPAFVPFLLGIITAVRLSERFPQHQWLILAVGLSLEGLSCCFIVMCSNYIVLMIPLGFLCCGIAIVYTVTMPYMAHLVDKRYVSTYGSVYGITGISFSAAFAVSPIVSGQMVNFLSFNRFNLCISALTCAWAPVMYVLRKLQEPAETNEDVAATPDKAAPLQKQSFNDKPLPIGEPTA